jgi:signal transduction histidine kinase
MATGLAHEINNPVTAIKLHAQLLEGETSAPQATRDSLGIIIAEAAKIEGLVSQWMFLARPQPPQTSRCDLCEIIAAAVRTHTPSAVHSGVRIANETAAGLWVDGDARRMSQAVGNLIINAIQAMAAHGGTLRITANDECRMTDDERVQPAHEAKPFVIRPPSLVICFHDTGRGFSEAALARHAELFFSEKEGGMGIGLSVASEILRAHGGELRVENSPAGGAVVTVILPLAAAQNLKSEI